MVSLMSEQLNDDLDEAIINAMETYWDQSEFHVVGPEEKKLDDGAIQLLYATITTQT